MMSLVNRNKNLFSGKGGSVGNCSSGSGSHCVVFILAREKREQNKGQKV